MDKLQLATMVAKELGVNIDDLNKKTDSNGFTMIDNGEPTVESSLHVAKSIMGLSKEEITVMLILSILTVGELIEKDRDETMEKFMSMFPVDSDGSEKSSGMTTAPNMDASTEAPYNHESDSVTDAIGIDPHVLNQKVTDIFESNRDVSKTSQAIELLEKGLTPRELAFMYNEKAMECAGKYSGEPVGDVPKSIKG